MPTSVFKQLGIGKAKLTTITLQLVDRSLAYPEGKIKDVLVRIDKFIFLDDFIISDFEADRRVRIIIGRPFLEIEDPLIPNDPFEGISNDYSHQDKDDTCLEDNLEEFSLKVQFKSLELPYENKQPNPSREESPELDLTILERHEKAFCRSCILPLSQAPRHRKPVVATCQLLSQTPSVIHYRNFDYFSGKIPYLAKELDLPKTSTENPIVIQDEETIDALKWNYFCDARLLPDEELVQGFYANLTKLDATEVLVCKKKTPLASKSINELFNLPDVKEYEYFSMMKNINWDFLQQVLNVVTNLGSQWIIRKYGSRSCRREYLKPFAKKGLSMLGRSFSRKSMIVPEKRPKVLKRLVENVHELNPPEPREPNHKNELKGIWQSWDEAKKTHFSDKYGDVAQLLFIKLDDALLKAMIHFWDPTYRCFMFNEVDMVLTIEEYSTLLHYDFRDLLRIYWKQNVNFWRLLANLMGLPVDIVKLRLKDKNSPYISWSDIRDVMGKANGDRHLKLFAFTVYGLIVFPKALGYVSVELVDFLFQIEKMVNSALAVLAETIIQSISSEGKETSVS
ncbi:hypothetical protein Goarm_006478 [Gossypium armourianum]|uniref:DUF7745 domain-containing protein n=1 Tax=Gossypium armourianum TaxID=34283 RepID=A0A7J9JKL4_9ROSI|nr:hypothetical protein [Gossypium armourianum]